MARSRSRILRLILGIPAAATRPSRRGFAVSTPEAAERLEQIGRTFLEGYHLALDERRADPLGARLDAIEAERRGWAYEGAAMALTLLDGLTPLGGSRLTRFLDGPAQRHVYMTYIGAGWALARLGLGSGPRAARRLERARARMDPLLGWLTLDGYGFHEGYFHARRSLEEQHVPAALRGYSLRVFDQGLGRSLWFARGASAPAIAATIGAFPEARRGDLWSGVGLACAYAGAIGADGIARVEAAAGRFALHAAQGAAFAAKARARAENPAEHTDLACRILCGCSAADAAAVTDLARPERADPHDDPPAYERWRLGIQDRLGAREAVA